jgi:isopentenyl-diphosphate delta-isomerase
MEKVILVNDVTRKPGSIEKMEAHRNGILHRAFSIFIFNKKEMLLQAKSYAQVS